jgi:CheY-like chemotaxis protein
MPETTSGDKEGGAEAARAARIGSARSDFISSLGRRVLELRTSLGGLEQDPGSPRLRDDLRRRVHALSAGARLLRFAAMATALAEAERVLERAAAVGGLERAEVRAIAEILESLPSLAWNEPTHEQGATERPPASGPIGETGAVPPTVLVIGPSGLADAITQSIEHPSEVDIECERTETPSTGLELARALAPDVAVIDADLPGARELIEKLGRDPLTEPMPLIVVGTWSTPEDGGKWVTAGASRALPKPVSPHELWKACVELSSGSTEPFHHTPLGPTTVDELTTRILDEVKRGLPDALVQGKATPIQLGDGSDILAAVWGAVARVRDLVTIKSGGSVRFSGRGPEGALPFAPWWGDGPPANQRGVEAKAQPEAPLEGRKVVVADDDPAVTWFIGGVLRAVGAKVREAHDGDRALDLCFRLNPDLVISDVLMPGLDGFALCRALKRDIALRDVPVILLSWKEDLLQRLRDLGADADGYLRKEASATAILQRVYEVLRTRARIEARLKGEGEVRGRLDGVTPRTLLHTISRFRPDARLSIRDASFLYEVELRGGAPKSATRTTSDGAFQRGNEVFAALLGVRAGRFVVARAEGPARGTLTGDLESQLQAPIANARAALRLLGGTRLLEVHRVSIAVDRVLAYLAATPEPARSLVTRLANGASPRGLILGSEVAPAQLEEVLCDLATHGAIVGVQGAGGVDLLQPALEEELSAIRRGGTPSNRPEQDVKLVVVDRSGEHRGAKEPAKVEVPKPAPIGPPKPVKLEPPRLDQVKPVDPPKYPPLPLPPIPPTGTPRQQGAKPEALPGAPRPPVPSPPDAPSPAGISPKVSVGAGVGIGGVMAVGDVADESLSKTIQALEAPRGSRPQTAAEENLEALFERASNAKPRASPEVSEDEDRTPSSLEAAVIREISDRTPLPAKAPTAPEPAPSIVDTSALKARLLGNANTVLASEPPPATPSLPPDAIVPGTSSEDRIRTSELASTGVSLPRAHRGEVASPAPTDPAASSPSTESPRGRSFLPAALVALGAMGLLVLAVRSGRDRIGERGRTGVAEPVVIPETVQTEPAASLPAPLAAPPTPSAAFSATRDEATFVAPSDSATASPSPPASGAPTSGEDLPLPMGAVVTPGQGLLDIETGGREAIYVDGVELGRGPFLRLTLAPGVHDVRLRAHGEERIRFVLIRAARRTRLPLSSAWTR